MMQVNTVQRTLVEAWGIVRETYVDPSFNHQDWDLTLESSLADTLSDETSEEAYSKIKSMLASLGDPFTRIITPKVSEILEQVKTLFYRLVLVLTLWSTWTTGMVWFSVDYVSKLGVANFLHLFVWIFPRNTKISE